MIFCALAKLPQKSADGQNQLLPARMASLGPALCAYMLNEICGHVPLQKNDRCKFSKLRHDRDVKQLRELSWQSFIYTTVCWMARTAAKSENTYTYSKCGLPINNDKLRLSKLHTRKTVSIYRNIWCFRNYDYWRRQIWYMVGMSFIQ